MKGNLLLSLCIYLFIAIMTKSTKCQFIVKEPKDQYTFATKSILFECTIENYSIETDLIEWCKNSFCTWGRPYELNDGRLQYKGLPRYYIVGNRNKGEWNLYIENITLNDEGEYKCSVTRRSDETNKAIKIESKAAVLNLMRSPQSISINTNQSSLMLISMRKNIIDCSVIDGIPAPIIKWKLNDGTPLNQFSKLTHSLEYDNNTKTFLNKYKSQLELDVTIDYEEKNIECYIEHPLLNNTMSDTRKINLNYAPILNISYEPNDENIIEGKTYKFSCDVKAKPKFENLRIFLNGMNSTTDNDITITATRDFNEKIITCSAENKISSSSIDKKLNVLYAPNFTEKPNDIVIVNKTKVITLNCLVDSNPKSTIVWLRNGIELIEIGNKLTLLDINIGSDYTCKASNQYHDSINFTSSIIIEGPPTFLGEKFYKIDKNTDLSVEFQVLSSPPYKNDLKCNKLTGIKSINDINNAINYNKEMIDNNKLKYSIKKIFDKNNLNMATKYELNIKTMEDDDYGVYSCSISNSLGQGEFIFEINLKTDNKNTLTIVLAVILSLLFVLVVILSFSVILCRYNLRKNKNYKNKCLPNVIDDNSSNPSGNSPNLSVSEWLNTGIVNDDQNSDKSSSSQKNLLSNDHSLSMNTNSNTNIAVITPNEQNMSSIMFNQPHYERAHINSYSNYESLQNYLNVSNYQAACLLNSRFQTNV